MSSKSIYFRTRFLSRPFWDTPVFVFCFTWITYTWQQANITLFFAEQVSLECAKTPYTNKPHLESHFLSHFLWFMQHCIVCLDYIKTHWIWWQFQQAHFILIQIMIISMIILLWFDWQFSRIYSNCKVW